MRNLAAALAAVVAVLAFPGQALAIGQCGLPSTKPVWVDFGTPDVAEIFGRPGLVLGVSTGEFPAQMRAAGAKTIYWDMNLNRRVGTPFAPADPALIVERANRLFDFAAQQSGCDKPLIVLNELFGSHLETPWTQSNSQYRDNVLALLRQLASRGARSFLLLSSRPYTDSDEAAGWWREAAQHADLVPEVYFNARLVYRLGPIAGNRHMRVAMRRAIGSLAAVGIPVSKLGIVLGFQTRKGAGGREGLQPDAAWYEVVKWQALSAREVAREMGIATIVSWGWATYSQSGDDGDKQATACVYLWTRNPSLCDGPGVAGPRFDASRTEGQLRLPAGVQCSVRGRGTIGQRAAVALERVTGDRQVALTILLARLAELPYAKIPYARVLAAERAVVALRFGGSRAAYGAALARAGASVSIGRSALGDELRRLQLARTMRARRPSGGEVSTFYFSYPDLVVRPVSLKPAAWWLGNRTSGLALAGLAPERIFRLPDGRESVVQALDGKYKVTAHGDPVPLGSVPLEQARPTITAALAAFARRAAFESWSAARQDYDLRLATCRRDDVPVPGTVRLTSYLPFLSLDGA